MKIKQILNYNNRGTIFCTPYIITWSVRFLENTKFHSDWWITYIAENESLEMKMVKW